MIDQQDTDDLFATPRPQPQAPAVARAPEPAAPSLPGSVGQRLRALRESRGLAVADCGRELHLPIKVLQRLEADQFGAAEDFVFLRGALKSYAKLLGLPTESCDEALRVAAPQEHPPLVSVARTSHTRWLLQRYGTAATYIVLTAMIAVPLVLLGLRGGLHPPDARIVSLDQAPAASGAPATSPPPSHAAGAEASPDGSPFRASMTPFAAIGFTDDGEPDVASLGAPPASAAPAGQHTLTLAASADCWFEITDVDGNKVDSGVLRAGETRDWHSAGVLHVTLGNAGGVSVSQDGQPVSLDSSQRGNVAHLDLFGPAGASEKD